MNDRLEFLEIFNVVREQTYQEWDAKNKSLPANKKEAVPSFLDIVNRTLQFAWYVDGYRKPVPADIPPEDNTSETKSELLTETPSE